MIGYFKIEYDGETVEYKEDPHLILYTEKKICLSGPELVDLRQLQFVSQPSIQKVMKQTPSRAQRSNYKITRRSEEVSGLVTIKRCA